ncbi:histone-lysine N-methyltransferase 2C-like [Penaeus chinensis]|uniref:histone-lysine N-methyltransferase 2C-like n=1 Tax=Penaeus chinensis TaxID=139456 RepID=UPI001FB67312|nr:histone-lysine N-methyltransferase 2C-like [Penaeus chinensis]
MFRFVCAFLASFGLAAGQFQLSLLSSLQPPPEPRTLLRPPPPPPPPAPSTPAVASRRPSLLSHAGLTGLAPPPPPTQFTASPPDVLNPFAALLALQSSEDATPLPALSSPTTIRFTIDDVPSSFEPSLFPPRDVSLQEDLSQDGSLASFEASRFSLEDEAPLAPSPAGAEHLGQLFFPTSKETREPKASPGVGGRAFGSDKEPLSPLTPYLGAADADFKPSLYFPFLLDSTEEPQNEFTLIEERNPRISSFLRPPPPQFYESSSDVFILKPVKVVSPEGAEESEEGAERPADHGKTKTPVPVMVDMDGDKDASRAAPKATKPPPTRKTLHFDEEFLSLLRNAAADKSNKPETSSQASPFWLDLGSEKSSGAWRLKGAEAASPPTRPRATTPSNSVEGGFFTKSIKSLTSSVSSSFNISSISLATNSTESLALPTEALFESEGPKIVSVGEVGEVPHDLEGAHTHTAPATLSASLKHGVQALNVSARTSGCPKLYGKVELTCDIHHDASDNTSMKMMWKKKSFLKGRPEEQIVAEDSNLMLEDSRLSLKRLKDSYSLVIKDFRPKDCGTYECEVRAADTVAASQLLLFTCL